MFLIDLNLYCFAKHLCTCLIGEIDKIIFQVQSTIVVLIKRRFSH